MNFFNFIFNLEHLELNSNNNYYYLKNDSLLFNLKINNIFKQINFTLNYIYLPIN